MAVKKSIDDIGNGSTGSYDYNTDASMTLTKYPPQGLDSDLVYPIDLDSQSFYPESIKFTVYHRESTSLDKIAKAAKQATDKNFDYMAIYNEDSSTTAHQYDMVAANLKKRAVEANTDADKGGRAKTPFLEDPIDWMKETYEESFLKDGVNWIEDVSPALAIGLNQPHIDKAKAITSLYMNMPNEITFAEPVGWEGSDLGFWGGLAKKGDSVLDAGVVSNMGAMLGAGTGAIGGIIGKAFNAVPGINMMSGGILGMLGGQGFQKTVEASFGNIANPYKEMTFSGIGFREFSFNFVFRARNEDEVIIVEKIIETFRHYSKPTFQRGRALLDYPEEFHIEFLTKEEGVDKFVNNRHIPQIKMCVCKGVTTNYTSQNTWRSLKSGAPVEISLQLQFEETELVTARDVTGDTTKDSPGRFGGKGKF